MTGFENDYSIARSISMLATHLIHLVDLLTYSNSDVHEMFY